MNTQHKVLPTRPRRVPARGRPGRRALLFAQLETQCLDPRRLSRVAQEFPERIKLTVEIVRALLASVRSRDGIVDLGQDRICLRGDIRVDALVEELDLQRGLSRQRAFSLLDCPVTTRTVSIPPVPYFGICWKQLRAT
jgi:hypothetical protein